MKKTYAEIEKDTQDLLTYWSEELKDVDFIVGISRGGLFPAMVVATTLVKPLVVAYINKQDEVFFDRGEWIKDKVVLVVDDIVRTGKTLSKIREVVFDNGATEVRTLVPYELTTAVESATYSSEVDEDIQFPWDEDEKVEFKVNN